MTSRSNKWTGGKYSASFNQQYGNWHIPSIFSFEQSDRSTQKERSITVSNELARLDFLEDEVQSMLTYPDAEAIIKTIKEANND